MREFHVKIDGLKVATVNETIPILAARSTMVLKNLTTASCIEVACDDVRHITNTRVYHRPSFDGQYMIVEGVATLPRIVHDGAMRYALKRHLYVCHFKSRTYELVEPLTTLESSMRICDSFLGGTTNCGASKEHERYERVIVVRRRDNKIVYENWLRAN